MGIGSNPHPPIALSFDLHTPFDPLNTTGAFPTDPSDLSGRVQDAVLLIPTRSHVFGK